MIANQSSVEMFSPEEVADLLKIKRSTVMRLYREGKLKGARLGHRTIRFSRYEINAYLNGAMNESPV